MDSSSAGCQEGFGRGELGKALDCRLLEVYDRVLCERDVLDAGLEMIECLFCGRKGVLDDDLESGPSTVFVCPEGSCGVVSCRECKRMDHRPKTCEQAREDAVASGRQTVEEAMSDAVVRHCPKCKTAFVKSDGCNKITCYKCGTMSCYICRKVISGYGHFKGYSGSNPPKSTEKFCYTFDAIEDREDEIAKEAGDAALKRYLETNPGVDKEKIGLGQNLLPLVAGPPIAV